MAEEKKAPRPAKKGELSDYLLSMSMQLETETLVKGIALFTAALAARASR